MHFPPTDFSGELIIDVLCKREIKVLSKQKNEKQQDIYLVEVTSNKRSYSTTMHQDVITFLYYRNK